MVIPDGRGNALGVRVEAAVDMPELEALAVGTTSESMANCVV